jgi:hypothetical protein
MLIGNKNNIKTKQPFSKKLKGLKSQGSPYWTGSELFV